MAVHRSSSRSWALVAVLSLVFATESGAAPLPRVRLSGGPTLGGADPAYGFGIGLSAPVTDRAAIRLDVAYDRFENDGGFEWSIPDLGFGQRVWYDRDEVETLLAGVELTPRASEPRAAMLLLMAGVARIEDGDQHVEDIGYLGSRTVPGERRTVAALALGVGFRFPIAGRTALRAQMQLIRFVTTRGLTLVVPLRAELEF